MAGEIKSGLNLIVGVFNPVIRSIFKAVKDVVMSVVRSVQGIIKDIRSNLAAALVIVGVILIVIAALSLGMPGLLAYLSTALSSYSSIFVGLSATGLLVMGGVAISLAFVLDSESAARVLNTIVDKIASAVGSVVEAAAEIASSIVSGVASGFLSGSSPILLAVFGGFIGYKLLTSDPSEPNS
jgi:phage-related protein